MTSTKYSISAANRITGKSRTTIARHISTGTLSCESDSNGTKLIDASELIRVYGDACDFAREQAKTTQTTEQHQETVPSNQSVHLQTMLDREIAERARERDQFTQQIDYISEALAKSQEGHNRATLLLQDQSKRGGDWQQALNSVEARIADEQTKARRELMEFRKSAKEQLSHYKRALDEERRKTLWQRIWRNK